MLEPTQTFSGQNIRIIDIDGKLRMSAVDICSGLGYSDPRTAWAKLKGRNPELAEISVATKLGTTDGKAYQTDTLDLEGVTNLCMISLGPKAQDFRRWARGILAEKIEQKLGDILPTTYLEALRGLVASLEINERQQARIDELEPKAAIHDIFLTAENTKDLGTVAKELGYGRNTFFRMLREANILMANNIPYEPHMRAGRFVIIEVPKEINGKIENITQTRATAKGELFLAKTYGIKG